MFKPRNAVSPARPRAGAALGLALGAACTLAQAQALVGGLSVSAAGPVSIDIQQTGSARLGALAQPAIVNSSGAGAVSLQVTQVAGATVPASARVEVYTQGSSATQVTLRQETTSHGAVSDVFGTLLLGTSSRGTGHDVTLLQQGSEAGGRLELTSGDRLTAYVVQGAGSTLGITTSGSDNVFGTATLPFTVAQGSAVNITHQGSNNTFRVATQASGDALSLHVKGDANIFTFDFPLAGDNAYKAVTWGSMALPVEVNGGNFAAARFGDPGKYYYAVYDATGVNAVEAAKAVVTPR